MKTIHIDEFKRDLNNIINNVSKNNLTLDISSESGDIIIMSKEQYNSILETMYLSSNESIKQSIIDGINSDCNDCISEENVSF